MHWSHQCIPHKESKIEIKSLYTYVYRQVCIYVHCIYTVKLLYGCSCWIKLLLERKYIWSCIENVKKILLQTMNNLTIRIKYNFKGFSF